MSLVFSVVGRLNLPNDVVADDFDFEDSFNDDLAAAADLMDLINPDGFVSFFVVPLVKLDNFLDLEGCSVVVVGVAGADLVGFELGLLKVDTPLLPLVNISLEDCGVNVFLPPTLPLSLFKVASFVATDEMRLGVDVRC